MKHIVTFILLSVFSSSSYSESIDCAEYKKENYKILREVDEFTNSAVGYGGIKPDHYSAYECILEASNSIDILKELVNSNNIPAQLYGLMGLYLISHEEYEKYKSKFDTNPSLVNTVSGCTVAREKVSEIVSYIESLPRAVR